MNRTLVVSIVVLVIIIVIIAYSSTQSNPRAVGDCVCFNGRKCINFDSAASTQTLTAIRDKMKPYETLYSSAHRGYSPKSQLITNLYEQSRKVVRTFVNAPEDSAVVYTKNTSESINLLAKLIITSGDTVLITEQEHHSNDLPFRELGANVVRVPVDCDGTLNYSEYVRLLHMYHPKLVSVTGVSNVTGAINDLKFMGEEAKKIGSLFSVDAAQAIAHIPIDMTDCNIDLLSFSSHKLYSSIHFTGTLIIPHRFLNRTPISPSGGTIKFVNAEGILWTDSLEERFEAGSPNTMGAIAQAIALAELRNIGFDAIREHEQKLLNHFLARVNEVDGLMLYGPTDYTQRTGNLVFNLSDYTHADLAKQLSDGFCIGTRSGCFCANIYVQKLLGIDDEGSRYAMDYARETDSTPDKFPGMVRVSFGLYNTTAEVDSLINALKVIASGKKIKCQNDKIATWGKKYNLC